MPRRALCVVLTLVLCGCRPQPDAEPSRSAPTFNRDVAPILFAHCAPCHRPGQEAVPFSLLTFADASQRADRISRAVEARQMPPWPPGSNDPAFIGARHLAPDQIETIRRWAAAGAPEGTDADRPPLPHFTDEWQLGTPDLVLTLPQPYVHQSGGHDVFRNVVFRPRTDTTRFVRAVEFRPGSAPVHHAILRVDATASSRALDGVDGQPGFDGMAALTAQNPEGHFIGWAPGRGPIIAPEGLPWRLEAGSDLVAELHLVHGKSAVAVQPVIGLYFTDTPPTRSPTMVVMGTKAIDIPAGERDYTIVDSYVLPVEVTLLSVYPHAHYLGKEMRVSATMPNGSARPLLHIRRWNFNWQQDYRYVSPVVLPPGTTITMRYTYDNSEDNAANPHHPPRRVSWGPQSSDEMGHLGLQMLTANVADAALISRQFAEREARDNVVGAELRVRRAPADAHAQMQLGSSYLEVGRIPDAITHLELAVRLDPKSAQAHNFLGGALLAAGRSSEAVTHLRQATSLARRDPHLQFNLGKALTRLGRPAEAAAQFERAILLYPDFAEAHQELGVLLFSQGRLRDALRHLQRAVDLAPGSAMAHSDLGGALAQAGQFAEARRHLQRALELQPDYAPARENLSRLPKQE